MRDFLLLSAIAALLVVAIRRPFVGILVWAWFTIMTPHQIAYGVYGLSLNVIIAAVTLIAYVVSGEFRKMRFDAISVAIIALAGWLTLSQIFSLNPENSLEYTDRFLKTLLFVFLCAQIATSKLRLHALIWTVVAGVGFFAAKGALFTLATLGEYRVQGLPDTVLADNNHFGIAVATTLPLILYLRSQTRAPWLRASLLALLVLSVFAIIGTHSRGAFVALAGFGFLLWLHARRKILLAAGVFAVLAPAIAFMPAKWTERMSTITAATQDESFMGRVDAWVINMKLALENPITGAGLRNSYLSDVARTVDLERWDRARAAHSIYFEMLGGAGFVGLLLYLGLFAAAFAALLAIRRRVNDGDADAWRPSLARALILALTIFSIGGASVSMEMWDGYLVLIACASALLRLTPGAPRTPRFRRVQNMQGAAINTSGNTHGNTGRAIRRVRI